MPFDKSLACQLVKSIAWEIFIFLCPKCASSNDCSLLMHFFIFLTIKSGKIQSMREFKFLKTYRSLFVDDAEDSPLEFEFFGDEFPAIKRKKIL